MYMEHFLCTRNNENHTWLMKISEISQIRSNNQNYKIIHI